MISFSGNSNLSGIKRNVKSLDREQLIVLRTMCVETWRLHGEKIKPTTKEKETFETVIKVINEEIKK